VPVRGGVLLARRNMRAAVALALRWRADLHALRALRVKAALAVAWRRQRSGSSRIRKQSLAGFCINFGCCAP